MKATKKSKYRLIGTKASKLIFNKYFVALSFFLVWLLFFDKNAMVTQWQLSRTIDQLEDQKDFLIADLESTKLLQADITKNKEKYAREKYFMKKPGERVFIVD